ncbi:hypothetical protein FHG87_005568 [Trinorchestia longiramus]|nr:hypothetical protein FHG87_005568 [Trinorchestia longiramus]
MAAAGFEPGSSRSQADSLTSRPSWWFQSTKLVVPVDKLVVPVDQDGGTSRPSWSTKLESYAVILAASTMAAAGFEPGSSRSQADSLTSRPSWWFQSTKLVIPVDQAGGSSRPSWWYQSTKLVVPVDQAGGKSTKLVVVDQAGVKRQEKGRKCRFKLGPETAQDVSNEDALLLITLLGRMKGFSSIMNDRLASQPQMSLQPKLKVSFGCECSLSVIVENKPTLCSPLTLSAFKDGISVPLFKTLHPNNGLRSYTQFDETVRLAMHYDIPFDKTIQNVVTLLQAHTSTCVHTETKKLVFLTHQLELFLQKQFSMNHYVLFCSSIIPKV